MMSFDLELVEELSLSSQAVSGVDGISNREVRSPYASKCMQNKPRFHYKMWALSLCVTHGEKRGIKTSLASKPHAPDNTISIGALAAVSIASKIQFNSGNGKNKCKTSLVALVRRKCSGTASTGSWGAT